MVKSEEREHGPFPTMGEAMSATPYFDYQIVRALTEVGLEKKPNG